MTYGEAHVAEQESLELVDGVFAQTIHIKDKAKQMSREDATRYYNTKFYKHWLDILNQEAPWREKLNAIHIQNQMFGCPQNAKLLKEIGELR